MKSQSRFPSRTTSGISGSAASVSLQQLVSQLSRDLLPMAVKRRSFILNDVDPALYTCSDRDTLAFVLWNMLNNAVQYTDGSCIRVEAREEGEAMLIRVQNRQAFFYSTPSYGLERLQEAVNKMNGCLSVDYSAAEGTTLAFIFHGREAA